MHNVSVYAALINLILVDCDFYFIFVTNFNDTRTVIIYNVQGNIDLIDFLPLFSTQQLHGRIIFVSVMVSGLKSSDLTIQYLTILLTLKCHIWVIATVIGLHPCSSSYFLSRSFSKVLHC